MSMTHSASRIRLASATRSALGVAALCAGTVLAASGCSAGITSTGQPSASTATSPAGAAGASPSAGVDVPGLPTSGVPGLPSTLPGGGTGSGPTGGTGTVAGASLPAGFPLPPGATATRVSDDGAEIAATVDVPDAGRAFAFWKSALPAAGYQVSSAQGAAGLFEIRFSGKGYGGNSQIAISQSRASVQLDRA